MQTQVQLHKPQMIAGGGNYLFWPLEKGACGYGVYIKEKGQGYGMGNLSIIFGANLFRGGWERDEYVYTNEVSLTCA